MTEGVGVGLTLIMADGRRVDHRWTDAELPLAVGRAIMGAVAEPNIDVDTGTIEESEHALTENYCHIVSVREFTLEEPGIVGLCGRVPKLHPGLHEAKGDPTISPCLGCLRTRCADCKALWEAGRR